MPRIVNVSQFPNMGVLLLTCTIERETTRAKKTFSCFRRLNIERALDMAKCAARSD
jgi:hypothetical protein